nr:hypothetical protein GCM10020092_074530 [Actinoplanes digitatis]
MARGRLRANRSTPPAAATRPRWTSGRPKAAFSLGHDQVGGEREFAAAGDGRALDGGDQRLAGRPGGEAEQAAALGDRVLAARRGLEVHARAEHGVAAGQYGDPGVRVGLERVDGAFQGPGGGQVDGVADGGPVQPDDGDRALPLDEHGRLAGRWQRRGRGVGDGEAVTGDLDAPAERVLGEQPVDQRAVAGAAHHPRAVRGERGDDAGLRFAVAAVRDRVRLDDGGAGADRADLAGGGAGQSQVGGDVAVPARRRAGGEHADRVLGEIPADGGGQAVPVRVGAQQRHQVGDGVAGVVVAGPAGEREPTGDGERAGRVVDRQPEFGGGDLHRRGEAGVQVDVADVVDGHPGVVEHGSATGGDSG